MSKYGIQSTGKVESSKLSVGDNFNGSEVVIENTKSKGMFVYTAKGDAVKIGLHPYIATVAGREKACTQLVLTENDIEDNKASIIVLSNKTKWLGRGMGITYNIELLKLNNKTFLFESIGREEKTFTSAEEYKQFADNAVKAILKS